jgi:hypothetical protein
MEQASFYVHSLVLSAKTVAQPSNNLLVHLDYKLNNSRKLFNKTERRKLTSSWRKKSEKNPYKSS